ncbi:MAG TPA: transglycosylase family protein [Mycobacteriales bacterium]|nr:transglycosylase family protein [Mycobacteriales bacterium]
MSLLRPRRNAKHAKPCKAAPAMVAGGLTAAFAVADAAAMASSASAASAEDFRRLRQCESGGNYRINTGNGYYGAYQFDRGTWRGLGYPGLAHQASPATQDEAARKLQSQRGWQPWPACSRKLGLGRGGSSSSSTAASAASTSSRDAVRASRSRSDRRVRLVVAPTAAPAFDGHVMTTADRKVFRSATKAWQQRMKARGWEIKADGYFGPKSARVAARFAAEKKLPVALPGEVDRTVWQAAWTLAVT